jgi:hypothetical protein
MTIIYLINHSTSKLFNQVCILSIFQKQIERSVSLILGILGNLVHFRNSFIVLFQSVIIRRGSKDIKGQSRIRS